MLEKSRTLLDYRKKLIKLLTDKLGYTYEDKRKDRHPKIDAHRMLHGPKVEGVMLLGDMERINDGEAHYRVDTPCTRMQFVGPSAAIPTPNRNSLTKDEALSRYFELLLCGWEFSMRKGSLGYDKSKGGDIQYGLVNIIDWNNPRRNSFTVYEGWKGVKTDNVAWDLIISVNHIPMAAVMIAPRTGDHRPCEEAYNEMRAQLDADPCLSTYAMFCIISDGETVLVGGPDDAPEWFFPWDAPESVAKEAENDGVNPKYLPFYALLNPETLVRYIYGFVRPIGEEDTIKYAAHSHQYYAAIEAGKHLINGQGKGYAVLPEHEEQIRPYPFETNLDTTKMLFRDYLMLQYDASQFPSSDEEEDSEETSVEFVSLPTMQTEQPEGVCVYRPKQALRSPLNTD